LVNFIQRVQKAVTDRIPSIRQPAPQSSTEKFMNEYGWLIKPKNKGAGVGWHVYYQAMDNVWVNACIQTYIDEVINLGFTIKDPEKKSQNKTHINYLQDLFHYPMGYTSYDTYAMYQTLMWKSYLGLGDAFSEVIYDFQYSNVPIGLKHIPTEWMQYYPDTDQWGFRADTHRFEEGELIHVKDPDIRGSVWGESKIDVIAKDLTMDILGQNHTLGILENDGLDPSGVIEYDKDIKPQVWERELKRLEADAQNHGKGTIILKGAKYNRAGVSNRDMEYSNLMNNIRDRIIATYGVPPAKVSIIETANLGSGSGNSQDKQFKKELKGKAKNFEDAFTRVMGKGEFQEIFQYNDLDIEDKLQRAQIEDIQIKNGSLTINEVRSAYGKNPVDWGDAPL